MLVSCDSRSSRRRRRDPEVHFLNLEPLAVPFTHLRVDLTPQWMDQQRMPLRNAKSRSGCVRSGASSGKLWMIGHYLWLLPPKRCRSHESIRFCGAASLASHDESQAMPLYRGKIGYATGQALSMTGLSRIAISQYVTCPRHKAQCKDINMYRAATLDTKYRTTAFSATHQTPRSDARTISRQQS